jgi:hypothetical protein
MPDGLELRNTQGGHGHSLGPLDRHTGDRRVRRRCRQHPPRRAPTWSPSTARSQSCPTWLATLLTPPPAPRPQGPPTKGLSTTRANAYIAAIQADELDKVEHAAEGRRQITLLGAARVFGQLVGGGELDADNASRGSCSTPLQVHIGVAGFTRAEAERTVTRGMTFGMRAPRIIARGTAGADNHVDEA